MENLAEGDVNLGDLAVGGENLDDFAEFGGENVVNQGAAEEIPGHGNDHFVMLEEDEIGDDLTDLDQDEIADWILANNWKKLGYVLCLLCWKKGIPKRFYKLTIIKKHYGERHKGLKDNYSCGRCGNNLVKKQFRQAHGCTVPLHFI